MILFLKNLKYFKKKSQKQQLQLNPDENAFNKNGKIGSNSSTVNLRNALEDLGNKLRNDASSAQFVSKLETQS